MNIILSTRYSNEEVTIKKEKYQNRRTCLIAWSDRDGLIMKLTVNIPEEPLEDDEVIIKDYSENEGALKCLILNNVVEIPHRTVRSGYVVMPVCRLCI